VASIAASNIYTSTLLLSKIFKLAGEPQSLAVESPFFLLIKILSINFNFTIYLPLIHFVWNLFHLSFDLRLAFDESFNGQSYNCNRSTFMK